MRRRLLLLLLFAAAAPLWAGPIARIPLPADLSGTLNGAEYKIHVPADWNGTLLVYAHGAAATSVEAVPPTTPGTSPNLEEHLLSHGYAVAGSFLADPEHTLALTRFFRATVAKPERTLVWGVSGGGWTSLDLIEKHPGTYDGAIPVAPVTIFDLDFSLRFDLAYAAAFGWPSDWWGPIEDIRDDLYGNEVTLIMPVYQWLNAANYPQWEFIRLVMKLPPTAWWEVDAVVGLPGWALLGWKALALRSNAELTYGGPLAQNVGSVYTLTPDELAYLSTLGVDAGALLASMNANANIVADPAARRWAERDRRLTGKLRRPVVTMHSPFDPILPPTHEAVYRELVDGAGHADMLVQTYVNTPGHINFAAEHYLAALAAMEHWLDSGEPPDATFFPESLGFDNSFVPPPWPY